MNLLNRTALGTVFILFSLPTQAAHQHLWDLGFGIGEINAPFYRGSAGRKEYFFPVPFGRLRGKVFRADEDGARGKIFQSDRAKLDISLAAHLPVPEVDEGPRVGMPKLDPLGEIGPAFEYRLWRSSDKHNKIKVELPLRAVISAGDPVLGYQGWRFTPYMEFQRKMRYRDVYWQASVAMGPLFGSNRYHDYFYQIDPQYANPDRPAYNAASGYSGSRITIDFSRSNTNYFVGFFYRYDNLNGADFVDSPLVEQRHYSIFGVVAVWIFSHSKQRAEHEE